MSNPFDIRAATWDREPRRINMAGEIFAALKAAIPLQADWRALDVGAGTGLLTLALAARVQRVLAVDSSAGMLAQLKEKMKTAAVPNVETLLADFGVDPLPAETFHLIASAMTLHHVPDTAGMLRAFHALLLPGGYVAIADLDSEDGSYHGGSTEVHHHGFDRQELAAKLAAAGFVDIAIRTATRAGKARDYPIFLAVARKPV